MSALEILRKQIEERKQKAQGGTAVSLQPSSVVIPTVFANTQPQESVESSAILQGITLDKPNSFPEEKDHEIEELKERLSKLQQMQQEASSVHKEQLESAKTEWDVERSSLKSQIESWKSKYELEVQHVMELDKKLQESQAVTQTDSSNQTAYIDSLLSEIQQLQRNDDKRNNQEQELLTQVQTLQRANTALDAQVTDLSHKLGSMQTDHEAKQLQWQNQVQLLQDELSDKSNLTQRYDALIKENAVLQDQYDQCRKLFDNAQYDITNLRQELDTLRNKANGDILETSTQPKTDRSENAELVSILQAELEGLKQDNFQQIMRAESLFHHNESLKASIQLCQQENQEWSSKYDFLTQQILKSEAEWKQSLDTLTQQSNRRDSELQMLLNEKKEQLLIMSNQLEKQAQFSESVIVENQQLKQRLSIQTFVDPSTVDALQTSFVHLKALYRSFAEFKPALLSWKQDLAVLASFVQSEVEKLGFQARSKDESFSLERSVLHNKIQTLQQNLEVLSSTPIIDPVIIPSSYVGNEVTAHIF